jgi:hypothetical protein
VYLEKVIHTRPSCVYTEVEDELEDEEREEITPSALIGVPFVMITI